MTVLELMERVGTKNETLTIAYIKDAIHLMQSNTKEKIKISKQDVLNASDNDDNVYKLPADIKVNEVMSGGFVKETYEAAWWAFATTSSFEECVIKAINRGHDSDTTGAVAGMIAGRHYGHSKIPDYFKDNLMLYDELFQTAIDLCCLEYKEARDN